MAIIKSFFFFIIAGLFEIGGGYLVWLWLKQDKRFGTVYLAVVYWLVMAWLQLYKQPALGVYMPHTEVYLLQWRFYGHGKLTALSPINTM